MSTRLVHRRLRARQRAQQFDQLCSDMLLFIRNYIEEHTHAPTLEEIGEACFLSKTGTLRYLSELEKQGKLWRQPYRPRGIVLLDDQGEPLRFTYAANREARLRARQEARAAETRAPSPRQKTSAG